MKLSQSLGLFFLKPKICCKKFALGESLINVSIKSNRLKIAIILSETENGNWWRPTSDGIEPNHHDKMLLKKLTNKSKSIAFWSKYLELFFFNLRLSPKTIKKRNEAGSSDLVGIRLRKAEKLARKFLSEAQKQLGKKEAFYEALERALHNYLKAKLNIETADISKEKITQILEEKKVDSETITKFIAVLQASDFARYTPVTNTEMTKEFEKAKEVIVQLDKQL